MDNVKMIIAIAVLLALLLYLVFLEIKSMNLLSRLTKKYEEGIDIGCFDIEDLREILEKEIGLFAICYSDYLIVQVRKKKIKFFIENGKVFTEYSKDKFGISRGVIQGNRLLRASRLKKAVAANEIMDQLAIRFNQDCFIMDNGDYHRANSYAIQYNAIFGASALIAAVILIYKAVSDVYKPISGTDNPIDMIKEGVPDKYPDITFGKAFDSYFKNTNWKVVKSDDKNVTIQFSGDFPEKDENDTDVKFRIQFIADKNNGDIYYGEMTAYDLVNNTTLQSLVVESVLKSVNEKSNFTTQELLRALKTEADSKVAKNTDNSNYDLSYGNYNERNTETEDSYEVEEEDDYEEDEESSENSDYIIPYSDSRYMTYDDLNGMNKGTLRVARNEIYARHGRKFKAKDLQAYFESKDWYYPFISADEFNDNMLSEIERYNASLIKSAEADAPEGDFAVNADEIFSLGEKEKIVKNMERYSTWEIEIKEENEQTNEYDLWTIKDDLKNNVVAIKKNGSGWAYYDINAGMSFGDTTFNVEQGLMYDQAWISGFWDFKESAFKRFMPNNKYTNKGYIIYDYIPEDGLGWSSSYIFEKDKSGKLVLREFISTRSSFTYPDFVIKYKYSNDPISDDE